MPVRWSKLFHRRWKKLPRDIRVKAIKVSSLLDTDRSHNSLRLKRLKAEPGYWEIRIDEDWRIILKIEGDLFLFHTIGRHDILDNFNEN